MKLCTLTLLLWVLTAADVPTFACEPEFYFLFRDEARQRLNQLDKPKTATDSIQRFVLLHNLAFHQDKKARERAEKLHQDLVPPASMKPLVNAYGGSLKMIRASHRSTGSKIFRSINPLSQSPKSEAHEGYSAISRSLEADSQNVIIRLLRATAACEIAEHMADMFDSAYLDLTWLEQSTDPADSVQRFLIELNWAKYYVKRDQREHSIEALELARLHLDRALARACTPAYEYWVTIWDKRVKERFREIPQKP